MQPQQAQEMVKMLPSTIFANSPVNMDIVQLQLARLQEPDLSFSLQEKSMVAQPTLPLNPGTKPLTTYVNSVVIEATVLMPVHLIWVTTLALGTAIMLDCAASVADMVFVLNHVLVFQMELFPLHQLSTL
jgi:hypothetical protein